jgi:large subunit ribosomal protein L24
MKIRRNDTVLVIAGKDRGKKGMVQRVIPNKNRLLIEGVNIVKRHQRATGGLRQAGIVQKEMSIDASNVMIICTKCNKPARIGMALIESGKRARMCEVCHEVME